MTLLRGIVRSGKGDFSFWLAKLESYYTQKTGMKLYPGTLNIHLSDAIFPTPKDSIRLEKEEYGGRVSVSMAPCRVFGRKAFILRPDTDVGKFGDPPERILEVATDVGIRDTYGIKDGDIVEVEVS
jgi:riboflavin kinase